MQCKCHTLVKLQLKRIKIAQKSDEGGKNCFWEKMELISYPAQKWCMMIFENLTFALNCEQVLNFLSAMRWRRQNTPGMCTKSCWSLLWLHSSWVLVCYSYCFGLASMYEGMSTEFSGKLSFSFPENFVIITFFLILILFPLLFFSSFKWPCERRQTFQWSRWHHMRQELDFGFDWTALTIFWDHVGWVLFTSKEEFIKLVVWCLEGIEPNLCDRWCHGL